MDGCAGAYETCATMALIETKVVEDGEIVTAPGIYAMSLPWYHKSCCDGPSVSFSGLNVMWSDSPAHYWVTAPDNPNRLPRKEREAFNFGQACHHLTLVGRKKFEETFSVRPEKWSDWRTKDSNKWRDEERAAGKVVITLDDLEQIVGIAKSLGAHPMIRAGILDGLVERSLIWKDPETGCWLKSRPDAIPTDTGDFSDLKTAASVDDTSIQRAITNFNYHAQGALVGAASRAVLGVEMQSFSLVFVEKTPPWCVRVITLRDEDLQRGAGQNRVMLHKFAECHATGIWPGPGDQNDAELMGLQPRYRDAVDQRLALEIPAIEAAKYERMEK